MTDPHAARPGHPTAGTGPDDPADLVDVLLEGGPLGLPAELRRHRALSTADTVKVAHRGGYEHFQRDDSGAFRWSMRTHMAE